MKKLLTRLPLAVTTLLLTACATQAPNTDYTAFKKSKPRSILVLPPLNESTDINGSDSVLSVTTYPLAEAGYYVIPVGLAKETFRQNGLTTAGDIHKVPPKKLREIFGADTALYINVDQYGSNYIIVNSVVIVSASARLVDLRNGQELFTNIATASSKGQDYSAFGLTGMLLSAVINQIINQVSDSSHAIADIAVQRLLSAGQQNGMLYGPYSPKYGAD